MKQISTSFILVFVLALFLVGSGLYTVYETDRALLVRLGKLVTDENDQIKVLEPGLHLKIPLLDSVLFFDTRLNMSEIPSARIVTNEKKDLIVDLYVEWRIKDYARFYTSTYGIGDTRDRAEDLLHQKVIDVLRAEFGQRTIRNVVSGERKELMEKLRKDTGEYVATLGMELIDVRIRRIDLPPEVSDAVFDRMRSERKRVATELRANGESKAEVIRAEAERQRRVLLAEAENEAQRLRGEGDALAVQIYAKSYNQSPEFYEFYRTLEAYQQTFNDKQDVLVLTPNGSFFKYFRNTLTKTKE